MVKLKVVVKVLAPVVFLIFLTSIPRPVSSKGQYVQPLNMGMQMAIPYDIANIFNRPIAGVTSVVLTVGLALVLLLSVITSPFGYFFGIPSKKYVMGSPPDKPVPLRRSFTPETESEFEAFLNSIFFLLPEESNPSCRAYIICFAHGTMKHLPLKALSLYKYFSQRLSGVPEEYREAVELGLEDNSRCEYRYQDCPKSIFSILVKTLINLLPERSRKKPKIPN